MAADELKEKKEDKKNGFRVVTKDRVYFLYAPSTNEKDTWVASLRAVLKARD